METLSKVIICVVAIVAFFFAIHAYVDARANRCEVDIAKQLNTTAVYVGGHCMVKGFGSLGGR